MSYVRENCVTFIGNIANDPEVSVFGKNETAKLTFSIGVDRNEKDEAKQQADFFNCEILGNYAKTANELLKKGDRVYLKGEVRNDRVVTEEKTTYYLKILVSKVINLTSKQRDEEEPPFA